MAGKKPEEYKGVAKFFSFLSRPEIQSDCHQATGYLPVTMEAYELTRKSGYYDKNPGTDVSVQQMIGKTTDKSRGVRLGNLVQVRTVVDEELEPCGPARRSPRKRWTPRSSAATSCWSASRRRTKADPPLSERSPRAGQWLNPASPPRAGD